MRTSPNLLTFVCPFAIYTVYRFGKAEYLKLVKIKINKKKKTISRKERKPHQTPLQCPIYKSITKLNDQTFF